MPSWRLLDSSEVRTESASRPGEPPAGVCSITSGGLGGSGLARKAGCTAVRRVVVAIGFGMAISLFLKH